MSNLTSTIVRFPEDELRRYKDLAQEMGISLSELVRRVLKSSGNVLIASGGERIKPSKMRKGAHIFDLEKYKKWATGKKNRDSIEHDEILYGGK